ncbi:MAG: acylphosphatase [Streptococcaceae bacterium]|jgi:acylphosphatase|nr:acylphosphatase [Streptococcaceae bacterium]
MKKLKLTVFGRVQGVGFRYTALNAARKMGVSGQVWNNADGSVTILAQADDTTLTHYINACRNGFGHGHWIKVERIDQQSGDFPDFNSFDVVYK